MAGYFYVAETSEFDEMRKMYEIKSFIWHHEELKLKFFEYVEYAEKNDMMSQLKACSLLFIRSLGF